MTLVLMMFFSLIPATTNDAKADPQYFTITLHSNCSGGHIGSSTGPVVKDLQISYRDRALDLKKIDTTKAYCSGYVFLGWYSVASATNSNCKRVTTSNYSNETHLYAHWVKAFSTLSFSAAGGTQVINLEGTPGHKWNVYSISSSSVRVSKVSGSDTKFSVSMSKRTDTATTTTGATINFRDNFGNGLSVSVSQQSLLSYINGQFTTGLRAKNEGGTPYKRFLNLTSKGVQVKYEEKAYAGWFVKWNSDEQKYDGCCTDSAMMDLLNRKLARDGRLSTTFFFDVRDVLLGLAVNNSLTKENYKNVSVTKRNDGNWAWSSVINGAPSNGGEKIFASATAESATFINAFGDYGYFDSASHHANYTVKIEHNTNQNVINETTIRNLLKTRPEGIFVYAKKSGGGQHAFVVVLGANGKILFIDNGIASAAGPVERTNVNDYGNTTSVFNNIITIAYFQ